MRFCILSVVLVLAACEGVGEPIHVHRADAEAAAAKERSRDPDSSSPPSYQTELHSFGEDGEHVRTIDVYAPYQLAAFGGELMGDDRGEWGGELMFRDAQGGVHKVLGQNVHGIEAMPFGVVVFAGLAHMRENTGEVYLLSPAEYGSVAAAPFRKLTGAPREVVRAVSGELVFKVDSGRAEKKGDHYEPVWDCYRMTTTGEVASLPCSSIIVVE